jgi:hypothetical protein
MYNIFIIKSLLKQKIGFAVDEPRQKLIPAIGTNILVGLADCWMP